jgi:LysR family transcriptional regulator, mexEF-oprN operon transcriptional activator
MHENYGRDIDLNLLRVFAVVAESGSVTAAAGRLYLTQPAVSAALRRLTRSVAAPLFARRGRGLVLTSRGERLYAQTHRHLKSIVDAALAPARFEPASSARTFRLGLSDAAESWLLPPLLRVLGQEAPHMRIIALPVQFRSVVAVLASGQVDAAVTVADEVPAGVLRQRLFTSRFVCLFDPRHASVGRQLTRAAYFAKDHVIVSYNGDLRGIVEDMVARQRSVRCSVASFGNVGALVDGTPLLATVPTIVAREIRRVRPHLATRPLPFGLSGAFNELLWPAAVDDDEAARFLRAHITRIARATGERSLMSHSRK